jgi:hypothetical protein
MTQLEKVRKYIEEEICNGGEMATWDIEKWGIGFGGMMGGTATRKARILCESKIIEHPKKEDGTVDRHKYIWVKKPPQQLSLM